MSDKRFDGSATPSGQAVVSRVTPLSVSSSLLQLSMKKIGAVKYSEEKEPLFKGLGMQPSAAQSDTNHVVCKVIQGDISLERVGFFFQYFRC